jgi:hypothetical protein
VEGGCGYWADGRCGVIDNVLVDLRLKTENSGLPACSIRSNCRWFSQSGASACRVCPEVITESDRHAEPSASNGEHVT